MVFSALVGDSLKTQSRVTISAWGPNTKLPPPPHHTSGYMDDVYVWGENPKHVQQVVDILEKIFAEHGLYVNHKKTNAIANVGTHTPGADKGTRSCLDGPRLPVSFAGGPAILAAELSTRARKAFFANRKTLCANTSLASRLKVHTAVVREAAPTWPLHESLLRCANTIQLQQVRTMLKMPRRSGEDWVSWNSRTLRHARMLLHMECPRWSTRALESIWRLWGHIGRSEDTTTRDLLWRGMHWWAAEQRKPAREGARHSGQFNSQMDTERHVCNNAGSTQWWIVAHDRAAWEHILDPFLAKHDVPWVTGKQAASPTWHPTRPGNYGPWPLHASPPLPRFFPQVFSQLDSPLGLTHFSESPAEHAHSCFCFVKRRLARD